MSSLKYRLEWQRKFRLNNPWYRLWEYARRRCMDPKHISYRWYGGKGIKFRLTRAEAKQIWIRDQAHLLVRPSLDRINADRDYCYSNCSFIELIDNIKKSKKYDEPNDEPIVWEE